MHRLPKTLRILSHRLTVELAPGLSHVGTPAHGVYEDATLTITLDSDNVLERQKVTLIHEALHALIGVSNMGEAATEEEAVSKLSPLILNFIRENKAAVAWLQEV